MKDKIFKPKTVLCVAAHPDDIDFGFAGSIAKWTQNGVKVYYLVLTDGSKGSDDKSLSSQELVGIRQIEQRAAAKILGAAEVYFADFEDGALMCSTEVKKQVVRYIRKVKPDTVLTMDPTMVYSVDENFKAFIPICSYLWFNNLAKK